ncbi:hypothetical protein XENOCAPTIV_005288 [Xenoophorus captivus]|uniref:Uncharacterized protein n=1 Tax=Xenoophorus captivus TaxID=1517983 RepID=A0ABV0RNU7_9TELE
MDKICFMENHFLFVNVCLWKSDISCDVDLHKLCLLLMEENNMVLAHDAPGTIRLYRDLRPLIREPLLLPDLGPVGERGCIRNGLIIAPSSCSFTFHEVNSKNSILGRKGARDCCADSGQPLTPTSSRDRNACFG